MLFIKFINFLWLLFFRDIIRLGEWDLSTEEDCETTDTGFRFCAPEPAQDFTYEEIVSHPEYNSRGKVSDDIALIRLTTPINFRQNSKYIHSTKGTLRFILLLLLLNKFRN